MDNFKYLQTFKACTFEEQSISKSICSDRLYNLQGEVYSLLGDLKMNNIVKKLNNEKFSPFVIELRNEAPQAIGFLRKNKAHLEQLVLQTGALLIRGGEFGNAAIMEQVSEVIFKDTLKSNTEHRPVVEGSGVQRPVDYSANEFLLWHNENTFMHSFPSKAIFACELPAASGGQTPIVDSRAVYDDIDEKIKQEFIEKKVMYVRKYESHDFIGLGWKTIFATNDKKEVEKKCKEQNTIFNWVNSDTLITRAVRPATFQHPLNGEISWINQVLHWHFSCLSTQTQADIKALFVHEHLFPRNCYFGDGSKIPDAYIDHIHCIYKKNQMAFDWRKGDLLLIDNILKAHSRNAYQGDRKLLVCFGDQISFS
jgi:hypothetical protein